MLSCEEKENEIVTSFQKKVFKKMWAVFWQPFFLAAVLSKIRLLEASAEPFFPDGKEKKNGRPYGRSGRNCFYSLFTYKNLQKWMPLKR